MAKDFYMAWNGSVVEDAGAYVSKGYNRYATALKKELTNLAEINGARLVSFNKSHYDCSCFIERNGKFVYISHSSTLKRLHDGVHIDLDYILIRTAEHTKDFRGGHNHFCKWHELPEIMNSLLKS